ncbi:MAG: isoleucine--tRNA ligase [Erysipelotrichaceae bacterium]|jgi:isoleucyl-tRNA synthetase|nr:isoleucine--tRNA ligase [Erysipelotrichaceae bacterium]
MELKDTILVSKTPFEMRANLAMKEPVLLKKWHDHDLYSLMNETKGLKRSFVLHDGPPYANGNIHLGHTLNRILKDFVLRYQNMNGLYTPFVFGWDTHGLPIENAVTKSGVNRKTTSVIEFRKLCEAYAVKQIATQKEQIRRLGVLGDFKHPFVTYDPHYESKQIEVFAALALKNLIYRGLKPVYWSYSSETALAEAEIEYHDVVSDAIYVAFKLKEPVAFLPNDTSFVIWTTTPWTLPANLAISVNPNFIYDVIKTEAYGHLVLLRDLEASVLETLGVKEYQVIKELHGRDLEGVLAAHPFYERAAPILLGNHVTNESGTGLVHTAPGHGLDDYLVSKKYHIEPYCPVDARGYFDDSVGPKLSGLFYETANEEVLKLLKEKNALLLASKITHSYPHDWRTHKPVIFRATPQWFCSINPLKKQILKAIKHVKWTPAWGEIRMQNMIEGRDDWTISRQRVWGLPIPIIYDEHHEPVIDAALFTHFAALIKEHGSNIWYQKDTVDLLSDAFKAAHPNYHRYTKETDILDVWFDSGASFYATGVDVPCDLYLEGNDQYRGWFNSSLIISVATKNVAPYKAVLSHGFVTDENWDKMSKSKGNGIDPLKIADTYGSDILRLWVALVDYKEDVRLSEGIIATTAETYRKLRNTMRFLIVSLNNGRFGTFDPKHDHLTSSSFIDQLLLARWKEVVLKYTKALAKYNFIEAVSEMMLFISFDLSSLYLDIIKDILYCESHRSKRRLEVQNTTYKILTEMMLLLTPILPFTMDEIKDFVPGYQRFSTQLDQMPKGKALTASEGELLHKYQEFKALRSEVLKEIEVLRQEKVIGAALESEVLITSNDRLLDDLLKLDSAELGRLFIVSRVTLARGEKQIVARKFVAKKCPRCWVYTDKLVAYHENEVCPRCQEVLEHDYQD